MPLARLLPWHPRKTLRVLYYSNYSGFFGGGEISLLTLLKWIDRERIEPMLLLPEFGSLADDATRMGIPSLTLTIPSLKHALAPWRLAVGLVALLRLFKRTHTDLVHVNATSRKALCAAMAARCARIPAVWHVRITESDGFLDRILFALYPCLITNSAATANRFSGYRSHGTQVRIVHNPVDTSVFFPMTRPSPVRASLGVSDGQVLVGVVGRLHASKGHAVFIEAVSLLANVSNIRFIIVGAGPLREGLQQQAAASPVADRLFFCGFRKDMPEVINAIDILVLPSHEESFGRVLIEAMACGKPVIATITGGVPEIVVDGLNGLLVPPGDASTLAKAIGVLADDAVLRQTMGHEGLERVRRLFTGERHARIIQNVYTELMSSASASSFARG